MIPGEPKTAFERAKALIEGLGGSVRAGQDRKAGRRYRVVSPGGRVIQTGAQGVIYFGIPEFVLVDRKMRNLDEGAWRDVT